MKSEQTDKIAAAMVAVQKAIKPASKTSANPFFKSKYADLSEVWHACHDALAANGIAVTQGGDVICGQPVMVTTLLHSSGQWISGAFPLVAVKPDPQAMGSAITYMRRYSLASMVGVLTEDDDGESAMSRNGGGHAGPKAVKSDGPPPSDVPPPTNGGGHVGEGKKPATAGNNGAGSPPPAVTTWVLQAKRAIDDAREVHELVQWKGKNESALVRLKAKHPSEYDAVMQEYDRAKVELAEVSAAGMP